MGADREAHISKKTVECKLTAISGDRYPSLEAAQAAALKPVARELADAFRKGLASGVLVVVDGKVVIAEDEDEEGTPRP